MVDFKDCFTPDEWEQLMLAKEVANNAPITLTYYTPLFRDVTTYKLELNGISLIGDGIKIYNRHWSSAKEILQQHFNIKD